MANLVEHKDKYTGRREIYSRFNYVSRDNIKTIINEAITVHDANVNEIEYLKQYVSGSTPIRRRTKAVRPEICNKVSVNKALQIVNFDTGYLLGEPIQYVVKSTNKENSNESNREIDEVITMNDILDSESRDSLDLELGYWLNICGVGYKGAFVRDESEILSEDDSRLKIMVLDPRNTFVVKTNTPDHTPLMAVTISIDSSTGIDITTYSCYTKNHYYEVCGENITVDEPKLMPYIPIVEYVLNPLRLGAFEPVLSLLDAIDNIRSNQLDGIEQVIQALMVFTNADINDEIFQSLKDKGCIRLPEGASVDYLVQELKQVDTNALVDAIETSIDDICCQPTRTGGSTSDTGTSVILKNGYEQAEAKAKISEKFFNKSERQFLKIVINILNVTANLSLKSYKIKIRFTRRNYENITSKTNVLTQMLSTDKIHPKLAFEHCGMFADPARAYKESSAYYESKVSEQEQALETEMQNQRMLSQKETQNENQNKAQSEVG